MSEQKRILVCGQPWVYQAPRKDRDTYPILEEIFADMSYAGLDGIEIGGYARHEDMVDRVGELSRKYSLPVVGAPWGAKMWDRTEHEAILKRAEIEIAGLAAVGGWTLGVSVGNTPTKKTEEQFDAQADVLREVMAICKKHNVVLNLHNHTDEVKDNEYDLSGTLARIPDIKLGPDLNWLLRAGIDPVDFIRRHASRIVYLHLRDQKADGLWPEAMGEGDMDYVSIGKALREIGFSGEATIELAHEKGFELTRPLRETWKMSREYVRKTMGY
jgi:sugar phosphate isomerase/epimerase